MDYIEILFYNFFLLFCLLYLWIISGKIKEAETGIIVFDFDEKIQKISYTIKDVLEMKNAPRYGDKVRNYVIYKFQEMKILNTVNQLIFLRDSWYLWVDKYWSIVTKYLKNQKKNLSNK